MTPGQQGLAAGARFGDYSVQRLVGGGGMGTVFLAEHAALGRRVALKVINPELVADPRVRERFAREAAAVGKLDHRGICTLYEFAEVDGHPFLAMRYVEGDTLGARIERCIAARTKGQPLPLIAAADAPTLLAEAAGSPLPLETSLLLVTIERVARALHFAHGHGVVHRDVKPANILLDKDGEPVLLDFGLARDEDAVTMTQTLDLVGTPAYMAPEQVAGYGRRPGAAVDVYSLAVTLYECLTLELPFTAASRRELFEAILFRDPVPVRQLNPMVPADLATVLGKAMEKDARRRYASAIDFAEELRRLRAGQPVQARRPGWPARLRRWVRRNRLAVGLMVTISSAAAGLGIAASVVHSQAERLDLLGTWSMLRACQMEEEQLYRLAPGPERLARMRDWLQRHADREDPDSLAARYQRIRGLVGEIEMPPLRARGYMNETPQQIAEELQSLRTLQRGGGIKPSLDGDQREFVVRRLAWLEREQGTLPAPAPSPPPGGDAQRHAADLWRLDLEQLASELHRYVVGDPRTGSADRREALWSVPSAFDRVRAAVAFDEQTLRDGTERHAAAWRAAADQFAQQVPAAPPLLPQADLVPLGADPASGLEEFGYPRSGRVPARDRTGALERTDDMAIVFVLIPGGHAKMGTLQPSSVGLISSFGIADTNLDPFLLAKFELTQYQWAMLGGGNPSCFQGQFLGESFGPAHPVETVSWDEATRVLAWHRFELPTEFQWEHACAAGARTQVYWGDEPMSEYENSTDADYLARNMAGLTSVSPFTLPNPRDRHLMTAPVGSYRANHFGLHDTLGNVAELCRDNFGFNFDEVRAGDGLRLTSMFAWKAIRGGCFSVPAQLYSRMPAPRDWSVPLVGLRPVRRPWQ